MSTLLVEVVKINEINIHPNADRLELATVKGWQVVVQKNLYQSGDKVIYIPIDSILPQELEERIFGPDSKIKLSKSRVRTIKIRKAISQGMIIPLDYLPSDQGPWDEGDNVMDILGITKFEPPKNAQASLRGNQVSKKQINPNFNKYTNLEHFKNYPDVFNPDDEVIITEKIHGTSFRCGYVKFEPNTWLKKQLQILGKWIKTTKLKVLYNFATKIAPEYEWVYGSRNVQLQQRKNSDPIYYNKNVYAECVDNYHLTKILKSNEVIYGEIYGDGIQKHYTYGCKENERRLVIYDIKVNNQWLSYDESIKFCKDRGLPYVPILYQGLYNKDKLVELTSGKSILNSIQKVREGAVIRSVNEEFTYMGRKVLKYINDDYLLLKDQSELH